MADVASTLRLWSKTAASNSPSGTTAISGGLDDNLQQIQATIRQYLASPATTPNATATTVDLSTADGSYVVLTGSTTITGFGTESAGITYVVRFTGTPVITHNATSLILPGGANITAVAGDIMMLYSEGSGNWRCLWYTNMSDLDSQIMPISASVGSNALTISASFLSLDFRSTTLGSGTVTRVKGTPSNLVISSGSTLGTTSAVQSDIAVLAINNAGTIELAAVNMAGGTQLDESNLVTTTAEGGAGAADSASTVYSTTARTSVAYRVLGIVRSTQATAGTWATAPSLIQGAGGEVTAVSRSGTFTPTLTNTTNITSSTAYVCHYIRVGSVVTVSGEVDITATSGATVLTELDMTIPVNSAFSSSIQAAGTAAFINSSHTAGAIFALSANKVRLSYYAGPGGSIPCAFHYTYRIV